MKEIGFVRTDFPTKFGIPRQSGLVKGLLGRIVFKPEYRQREAFKGLEDFSHIWVLWDFSLAKNNGFKATVAPPRLGGRVKKGVFATRAPFRPNNIGLSCLKLLSIEYSESEGTVLLVEGVDMVDMTPVYDIKPYIPYTDCIPEAKGGFTEETIKHELTVVFPENLLSRLPEVKQDICISILKQDPRPAYDTDDSRAYGVSFAGFDIRFKVDSESKVLTVFEVVELEGNVIVDKVK